VNLTPEQIKELRLEMGMTLKQFAKKTGVKSKYTVWKWEHGKAVPNRKPIPTPGKVISRLWKRYVKGEKK